MNFILKGARLLYKFKHYKSFDSIKMISWKNCAYQNIIGGPIQIRSMTPLINIIGICFFSQKYVFIILEAHQIHTEVNL